MTAAELKPVGPPRTAAHAAASGHHLVLGLLVRRWRTYGARLGARPRILRSAPRRPATCVGPTSEEPSLPKRNYGYEKRQKELNRQRKKEEKRQRKLERSKTGPDETPAGETASLDLPPQE